MGIEFSAPWREMHVQVLVVGLDNAGKTTLLRYLRANKKQRAIEDVAPTVGMQRELLHLPEHNLRLTAFDMSGHSRYRNLWEARLDDDTAGIIFVIDSADSMRFIVARDELDVLLNQPTMLKPPPIPILFLANKSDLPTAASPPSVAHKMQLTALPANAGPWHICATNGLTGVGLHDGFDWLANEIKKIVTVKKKGRR